MKTCRPMTVRSQVLAGRRQGTLCEPQCRGVAESAWPEAKTRRVAGGREARLLVGAKLGASCREEFVALLEVPQTHLNAICVTQKLAFQTILVSFLCFVLVWAGGRERARVSLWRGQALCLRCGPRFRMDKSKQSLFLCSPASLPPSLNPNQNLHVAQRNTIPVITNPGSTL